MALITGFLLLMFKNISFKDCYSKKPIFEFTVLHTLSELVYVNRAHYSS